MEMVDGLCDGAQHFECHNHLASVVLPTNHNYPPPALPRGRDSRLSYVESRWPADMDPVVRDSVASLLTRGSHPDHVVDLVISMSQDMETLRRHPNVTNEQHRDIGLAAYSVAMESAKLWSEVFTTKKEKEEHDVLLLMLNDWLYRLRTTANATTSNTTTIQQPQKQPQEGDERRALQTSSITDSLFGLFDNIDTNQLIVIFTEVMQGDTVGAVDGALEGLILMTGFAGSEDNRTMIDTTLTYAVDRSLIAMVTVIVESVCNENSTEDILCATLQAIDGSEGGGLFETILGAFLPGSGTPSPGNSTDQRPCSSLCNFFPNLPNCLNCDDGSGSTNGDASEDYCPFPTLPNCGLDLLNGDEEAASEDQGIVCTNFPNLPQCVSEDSGDENDGENGGGNGIGDGINDVVCITFPALPQCQNDPDENGGTTPPGGENDGSEDPTLTCTLFPNLPACVAAVTPSPVSTPAPVPASTPAPLEAGTTAAPVTTPAPNPAPSAVPTIKGDIGEVIGEILECPFPNRPNCGCDLFPNMPSCV